MAVRWFYARISHVLDAPSDITFGFNVLHENPRLITHGSCEIMHGAQVLKAKIYTKFHEDYAWTMRKLAYFRFSL